MRSRSAGIAPHVSLATAVGWVALAVIAVGVMVLLVQRGASALVGTSPQLTVDQQMNQVHLMRTSIAQVMTASAVFIGVVFAARGYLLSRQTQRTDRLSAAVEHLGSERASVRVGGVYSLEFLAAEEPALWSTTEDVLCALIRDEAKLDETKQRPSVGDDVQAALTVIGRRPFEHPGQRGTAINWQGLDLAGADLTAAPNLARVRFNGSRLNGALLVDAKLSGAEFIDACLDGADLSSATLTDAKFRDATFSGAQFYKAIVEGADFENCDLSLALNVPESLRPRAKGNI